MIVRILLLVAMVFSAVCVGLGADPDGRPAQQGIPADRPSQVYSPLDAAEESHRLAEERRRWAVDRQLEVIDRIRQTHAAAAAGYFDMTTVPGYRAAARRALRHGYPPPVPAPWPGYGVPVRPGALPLAPYGGALPYYPPVQQPIGHERIWTGPNSYIYRPVYPEPFQPAPVEPGRQPTPAEPWRPQPPAPPDVPPPPQPDEFPEIPEPPVVPMPGPREF